MLLPPPGTHIVQQAVETLVPDIIYLSLTVATKLVSGDREPNQSQAKILRLVPV